MTCKRLRIRLRSLLGCAVGLMAAVLAACGGGSEPVASSPVAQSPPPAQPTPVQPRSGYDWQGRYVGIVTIGGTDYFGDALLTGDGMVRLYVGGPYTDNGLLQQKPAAGSMQLAGTLAPAPQNHAAGQGTVLGEQCSLSNPSRFCSSPGSASLDVTIASGALEGQVTVTGAQGSESWSLQLFPWTNYYILPALPSEVTGSFKELIAEFAVAGDTAIVTQPDGSMSFNAPHSGCSGSGSIGPHGGVVAANVYDVHLTLSGCSGAYAYLNGDYRGLATTTPSDAWNYDSLLRMWLSQKSTAGGAAPAITTLAG